MANDPTYNISPLLRSALFNGGVFIYFGAADLSIESEMIVSGYAIDFAQASLTIESDLSVSGFAIASISASLDGLIDTTVSAFSVLTASAILTIESDLSVSGFSIKNAVSSQSIESNLVVSAFSIKRASSSQTIESNLTVNPFAIRTASSNLSGLMDISVTTPIIVNILGNISFSISSNFIIPDLIRFTPSSQNPGSYIPLVLLDGIPLTDQNRKFNNSNKPVFVEKANWNSSKSRYYKRSTSGKQSFKLSWEWLPSDKENTIDKRQARNFIKEKSMDPDYHTLTVIKYGENPEDVFEETEYNVFITNYSEDLIRRDLESGTYFWRCDMELEEI